VAVPRQAIQEGRVRGGDLLIVLLLGTHEQPFERAIDAVVPLTATDDVVVQHGHTSPRPDLQRVTWLEFVPYERIVELCRQATGVISHAGVGTIMTVLANGKTPVVVPRLARYGEHVDDHQLQIAREFDAHGMVVAAEEHDDIRAALRRAASAPVAREASGSLARAIAAAVDGPNPPRRRSTPLSVGTRTRS
jgi:UDP-N-acetylglucosamine transferase subunit ALG13